MLKKLWFIQIPVEIVALLAVSAKAPEEVQSLFGDASSKLKSAFKCLDFQERHKRATRVA